MRLADVLQKNKKSILKKWFQAIINFYPPDTCQFIDRQKDQFANPLGHTFREGTSKIFEELLKDKCTDEIQEPLDSIVKILAVQDFTPSGAVSFLFVLKGVVREEAEKEGLEEYFQELLEFETRIDQVSLLCFEKYVQNKEKIWEFKANAVRDRTYNLLKRANLWGDPASFSEEDSADDTKDRATKAR